MDEARKTEAENYLGERTGILEYRYVRYAAVADILFAHGLNDTSLLMDVGAGMCDFDFYLRTTRGWKGRYLPVDASIDGSDLETAALPIKADYVTAIEVIEHVANPDFIDRLKAATKTHLVVTTPNTSYLGEEAVVAMDRTHVRPYYDAELHALGFNISVHAFFGQRNDSILADWAGPAEHLL